MPVRLRITLLFSLLVFIIFSIICVGIYYFSYQARLNNIKTRLTNRGITTARLLSQQEVFDQQVIRRIDSVTTLALKHKLVQAYDYQNQKIYEYKDRRNDSLGVSARLLDDARVAGRVYFKQGGKEAIAYHYADNQNRMVVVTAGVDVDGWQNLDRLQDILIYGFLVGNLLVLISGYFFSGRLLQPLKRITREVADISAQNLTRRLKTGNSKDELYNLVTTVNEVLNRLQESFELQRRFISNASHELSTPLTAVSSQLEVALLRERDASEYREVLKSVYQDIQHMSKLTLTLLEFAKASGNAGGLEISLIRIDEIILEMPAQLAKINPGFSAVLSFENLPEEEERLIVAGNEPLLETAIKNIVVNACKYSTDQQAIINLASKDDTLLLTISDKGVGIPKDEIENIFQPFYRVEESRAAGGFGLGLSMAQRIIKLHKGTISVASEVNKGTTFTISLPVAGI